MPLGWRPADVVQKFPVYKIEDVNHFEKYDPKISSAMLVWSWVQISVALLFISYLFGNIAGIGSPNMFVYGGFIFLSVYAYTELMDNNPYFFVWELIKNGMGIYFLVDQGDWFGLIAILEGAHYFIYLYFFASAVVTVRFSMQVSQVKPWQTFKI